MDTTGPKSLDATGKNVPLGFHKAYGGMGLHPQMYNSLTEQVLQTRVVGIDGMERQTSGNGTVFRGVRPPQGHPFRCYWAGMIDNDPVLGVLNGSVFWGGTDEMDIQQAYRGYVSSGNSDQSLLRGGEFDIDIEFGAYGVDDSVVMSSGDAAAAAIRFKIKSDTHYVVSMDFSAAKPMLRISDIDTYTTKIDSTGWAPCELSVTIAHVLADGRIYQVVEGDIYKPVVARAAFPKHPFQVDLDGTVTYEPAINLETGLVETYARIKNRIRIEQGFVFGFNKFKGGSESSLGHPYPSGTWINTGSDGSGDPAPSGGSGSSGGSGGSGSGSGSSGSGSSGSGSSGSSGPTSSGTVGVGNNGSYYKSGSYYSNSKSGNAASITGNGTGVYHTPTLSGAAGSITGTPGTSSGSSSSGAVTSGTVVSQSQTITYDNAVAWDYKLLNDYVTTYGSGADFNESYLLNANKQWVDLTSFEDGTGKPVSVFLKFKREQTVAGTEPTSNGWNVTVCLDSTDKMKKELNLYGYTLDRTRYCDWQNYLVECSRYVGTTVIDLILNSLTFTETQVDRGISFAADGEFCVEIAKLVPTVQQFDDGSLMHTWEVYQQLRSDYFFYPPFDAGYSHTEATYTLTGGTNLTGLIPGGG